MRLFIYGYGFVGRTLARRMRAKGWDVSATYRNPADGEAMRAEGVDAVAAEDKDAIAARLSDAQAVLVTPPPGPEGCPALQVLVPALAKAGAFPDWIGYLSTTGVYGDRRGGWAFEDSRLAAQSLEGARRVAAERDWLEVARGMGLTLTVHRLPGIYGPGRSAFDRLREGRAKRYDAPGHVVGRVHVDDLAAGLEASIARPRAGGIYNLVDDAPAANSEVIAHAAALLGLPAPPLTPLDIDALPVKAQRFYRENRRVSNARAKAELGWRLAYPTYREGLAAILAAEG
ncbi:NAD(P)-dependent oxidoreductase [Phenylobacterium sp. Root77]|uniref:SDR family oxidoreductase n=1 Tax=unclassified Phenylobacterium TaxID=2640670 RepID=UPI0006F25F17|nr:MULTISPECIES: SDR family oxidoreductase [unclassified Phenylobacterium]KQW73227.1 NAD(P)-dependent oxidoreductase [Phenylobacterium sp. Root1277]KQW92447.1 NAD(P)-dependent oxidoreductase [Phenylobacterium sp. Root1290]KRC40676.1 NAD(P)-dependent oxidoreductase [Phenylobacterium sp. Root77]